MVKTNFSVTFCWLWLFFFCFTIVSCNTSEQQKPVIAPAFYHWKTLFNPTEAEQRYLDSIGVKKIYVKFFDVDWDEASQQPVPLATVEIDSSHLHGLEIVPTIFITNRCLLNLPMQQVDTLAWLIFQKIKSFETKPSQEIQFDCDWTAQTQAKYFALLNSVRSIVESDSPFTIHHSPLKISTTIRLHQFKYPEKTGVPPVDRGMLMCYNMGDLDDWATENSILDLATAKTYLLQHAKSYPLSLDFALPLFRWGILFRDGRLVKLLNDLSAADLQDTARFQKTAENRYKVLKSTYLNAYYLYAGDQLRLEGIEQESLLGMAKLLREQENDTSLTVAFYHLDSTATILFPKEKIEEVLEQF
ncbi:MAG: hypothetical protein GC192_23680 [Bacteroidetes bacterium]|nr:hypothetical protein [Bacteroidota bacterium]